MLPDSWIEKLFQKFEDWYGAKWAAQYGDFPRERVKATWAEELGGFASQGDAIAQAINAQKNSPFPPTLPEFLVLCREAAKRIGNGAKVPALTHVRTDDELEHQRQMSQRIGQAIGSGKLRDGIDEHWATHPRSAMHLKFIFEASERDPRFQRCITSMVERGVCSADGRLLKRYAGNGGWERLGA